MSDNIYVPRETTADGWELTDCEPAFYGDDEDDAIVWGDRYPGALDGYDDPDSVNYRGMNGPVEFGGRIYDDSNPYGISCGNPNCRAAGDCYCCD